MTGPRIDSAGLRGFLLCGGTITLSDWLGMDDEVRARLQEAAEQIQLEQAVATGLAAHSPKLALRLFRDVDGGQAERSFALRAACARLVQRAGGSHG